MPRDLLVGWTGRPEFDDLRRIVDYLGLGITDRFDQPLHMGISAAGSHIFTPAELAHAELGIINLHMAPLPEYRGRFSATHAILDGAPEFGVTVHYVDEGIDTGPIIDEVRWPIEDTDTAKSLRRRALTEGYWILKRTLFRALLISHRLASRPQDESKARYFDRFSLPAPDPSNPLLARALTA